MKRYVDGKGVAFSEHRALLPASTHDWPKAGIVKNQQTLAEYANHSDGRCQVCSARHEYNPDTGQFIQVELHHIVGGSRGRSDERTNLLALCQECHRKVKTSALPQGAILWYKWRADQYGTDWLRLAILSRTFLPDLILLDKEDNS